MFAIEGKGGKELSGRRRVGGDSDWEIVLLTAIVIVLLRARNSVAIPFIR